MAVITQQRSRTRRIERELVIPLLLVVALVLTVLSIGLGAVHIAPVDVVKSIFTNGEQHFVIWDLRLPRVLLCWLVGSALAVSGGVIQGVIRNPLAAPDIVGITRGAGFTAATVILLYPTAPVSAIPIAAFVGGVAAFSLVYFFAYRRGTSPTRLALVGIAVSALFESGIRYLLVKNPLSVNGTLTWLAGSLVGRDMSAVYQILPWVIVLVPLAVYFAYRLDVLGLGDDLAGGLGESVEQTRRITLLIGVALASAAVAVAGTIGFIGLIAPHMARRLVGPKHIVLLPASALLGTILLLIADTLGRTIAPPLEIPAGLITALIGGPYFLYLLATTGK